MPVEPIPPGYHTVTPYLVVPNVTNLVKFLERAFDARVTVPPLMRADGGIMHTEVQIGDSRVMMGESSDKWPSMPAAVFLYLPDCNESYQRGLAAGGISVMEPADQFYGDRMGGVQDPSGCQWWVATHIEDLSPEQMGERRDAYLATLAGAAT